MRSFIKKQNKSILYLYYMKSISQTGTSSVIFRLNKISQWLNPYYIFSLENQNSKIITIFTGDDISNYPLIYNEFEWVNGVSFSATASRFDLDSGNYFLNIYETQYQYDLNLGSASLIYTNEIKIEGTPVPEIISFTQSDSDTIVYFE